MGGSGSEGFAAKDTEEDSMTGYCNTCGEMVSGKRDLCPTCLANQAKLADLNASSMALLVSDAVKKERDRILAVFENAPHRSTADDGTEVVEWVAADFRVGISLKEPRADSWFFVFGNGARMCGGDVK